MSEGPNPRGLDLLIKLIDRHLATLPPDLPEDKRQTEVFGYTILVACALLEKMEEQWKPSKPIVYASVASTSMWTYVSVFTAQTGGTNEPLHP